MMVCGLHSWGDTFHVVARLYQACCGLQMLTFDGKLAHPPTTHLIIAGVYMAATLVLLTAPLALRQQEWQTCCVGC